MKSEAFSAFLVEDEPHCRADFRATLREFPQVRLVGEADSIPAAEKFLQSQHVDLLFLDISVGRDNGLDLLEKLPRPPLVIALTAHTQHAARGFALDLVDYILKPVDPTRLESALEKAQNRRAAVWLQKGRATFQVELDGKKTSVDLSEILGAESTGNYVLLHTSRGKAIKRTTYAQLCKKLPPALFMQTGRGRKVAIRTVRSWNRNRAGRLILDLADGSQVGVTKSHTASVLKILENKI